VPKYNYLSKIEFRIQGMPCLIGIKEVDDIGLVDDWEILDRKGYRAPWLENKMNSADNMRVEGALLDWTTCNITDYFDE